MLVSACNFIQSNLAWWRSKGRQEMDIDPDGNCHGDIDWAGSKLSDSASEWRALGYDEAAGRWLWLEVVQVRQQWRAWHVLALKCSYSWRSELKRPGFLWVWFFYTAKLCVSWSLFLSSCLCHSSVSVQVFYDWRCLFAVSREGVWLQVVHWTLYYKRRGVESLLSWG